MLRKLALQLLGLILAIVPLGSLVLRFLRHGPTRLFQAKKQRNRRPSVLDDYGLHGYLMASDNVKLHYVEKGNRSRPLMLFLHGFPEFWFSWRYQIRHFASSYWCVAIDMRGYNDSEKPSGIHNYSIDALVADVKAVIEGLGRSQCILVAHDWGGAVAYAFAAAWPDMVSQLIACNIPHPKAVQDQQAKSWKQRFMSWYMLFFQCPWVPEQFLASSDYAVLHDIVNELNEDDPKAISEAYKYAFRDPATMTAAVNYYRCALQRPQRGFGRGGRVKVPVLSIFGTGDKYLSVEAALGTRNYVDNLTEEFIDGASHWVQMECPTVVNQKIEGFLQEESKR